MSRSDQWFVGILLGVGVFVAAGYWMHWSEWGTVDVELDRAPHRRYEYRIDPNAASWVEWLQLEGIGEALARRIVQDREQHGPFQSIDDLARVKGIGPKTLDKLRPYLLDPKLTGRPAGP